MRKSAVTAYKLLKSKVGQPVTPAELETAMAVGPYAGREVWILKKRLGLEITTQKNGREVVSYTLTTVPKPEPAMITEHFAKGRKAKSKLVAKAEAKVVKTVAKEAAEKPKVTKTKKAKTAPAVEVKLETGPTEESLAVIDTLDNGEVAAFSVDPEFDSADDLPEFLQRDTAGAE